MSSTGQATLSGQAQLRMQQGSGTPVPQQPPPMLMRSASDASGAFGVFGTQKMMVQTASAHVATPKLVQRQIHPPVPAASQDSEILRRLEAIEAKVGDRCGLLEKLSKQQAQLDRLENLARENEQLRAQVRNDQRRSMQNPSEPRLISAHCAVPNSKEIVSTRSPRQSTGGGGKTTPGYGGSREGARPRGAHVSPREGHDVAGVEESEGPVHVVTRGTSNKGESASIADPAIFTAIGAWPRQAPGRCAAPGEQQPKAQRSPRSAGAGAGPPKPFNELETRLHELEFALGLPLGGPEHGTGTRCMRNIFCSRGSEGAGESK